MKKKPVAQVDSPVASVASPVAPPTEKPTNDLVTLAGQIPAEILQQVATAVRSGRCMIATWHIDSAEMIQMNRTTIAFPVNDFSRAINLLQQDLDANK